MAKTTNKNILDDKNTKTCVYNKKVYNVLPKMVSNNYVLEDETGYKFVVPEYDVRFQSDHKYPRFVTWTDDRMYGDDARLSGLVYGVYDNMINDKYHIPGVKITSYDQAVNASKQLNSELSNCYFY